MRGIVSKTFDWILHPGFDEQTSIGEWAAFLVIVLILNFFWFTVLRNVGEGS